MLPVLARGWVGRSALACASPARNTMARNCATALSRSAGCCRVWATAAAYCASVTPCARAPWRSQASKKLLRTKPLRRLSCQLSHHKRQAPARSWAWLGALRPGAGTARSASCGGVTAWLTSGHTTLKAGHTVLPCSRRKKGVSAGAKRAAHANKVSAGSWLAKAWLVAVSRLMRASTSCKRVKGARAKRSSSCAKAALAGAPPGAKALRHCAHQASELSMAVGSSSGLSSACSWLAGESSTM